MNTSFIRWLLLCSLAVSPTVGCSEEEEEEKELQPCDFAAQKGCRSGRSCEEVAGGEPTCFDSMYVRGKVFNLVSKEPVKGAQVVARDVNGAAVSSVATSDAEGIYRLAVPVQRNADGTPAVQPQYSLRADAAGFQTFPTPPRTAIPLTIVPGEKNTFQTLGTDIALIPLEDVTGLGTISGKVVADSPGRTLVVATGGSSAIADRKGAFTIFNVPAGAVEVRGYHQGLNLEPKSVELAAGQRVTGVELKDLGKPAVKVTGTITFVNPGSGVTSVILVVKETFLEAVARGESPPGLKAENVVGPFTIEGVPDGNYVVLAAFPDDDFVRDESDIGGTEILSITVAGADLAVPDSFKVTGALNVLSPNPAEPVSGTPTFSWEDDSSEKRYSIVVFDALGTQIWSKEDVPAVSSGGVVTQAYEGPALTSGMVYQFKARSWSDVAPNGSILSGTEDLKGVFTYQ